MTTLSSNRALITRLIFVALFLTMTVLLIGCGGSHLHKGLTTDPSWKETQLAPSQKVGAPKPVAGSKENIPKAEEK
jgi:hypothetical protein